MSWLFVQPLSVRGGLIQKARPISRAITPGKLSATEGEAVLKRAATRAIAEQRSLGLTEWTGGEYHTDNFIMHMHACLTGVEVDKPQAEDPFDYDDLAHARITGKLEAPNGLGYAAAYRREKNLPGGVNKAAVVGL